MDSIEDFGKQFNRHQDISGVWGSKKMLEDSTFPFDLKKIKDKKFVK